MRKFIRGTGGPGRFEQCWAFLAGKFRLHHCVYPDLMALSAVALSPYSLRPSEMKKLAWSTTDIPPGRHRDHSLSSGFVLNIAAHWNHEGVTLISTVVQREKYTRVYLEKSVLEGHPGSILTTGWAGMFFEVPVISVSLLSSKKEPIGI